MNLFFLILFLLLIILTEIAIRWLDQQRKSNIVSIKSLNNSLEIIEELSYLPTVKNDTLVQSLNRLAEGFFRQEQYSAFIILFKDNFFFKFGPALRYFNDRSKFKNTDDLEKFLDSETEVEGKKENPSEEIFIKDLTAADFFLPIKQELPWQIAVYKSLTYRGRKMGKVFFLKPEKIMPEKKERDFLVATTSIITYILRRNQVDSWLPLADQLKAVNVPW